MPRARVNSIIVGAGLMGRWHAAFLPRAGGVLAAVVDPNREAAARLGDAPVFSTLPDALSAVAADVVHVCTPPRVHAELIAQALKGGCYVVAEKPVADTEAEARELSGLASSHGRFVVPVHQFPFQRGFRTLIAKLPALGTLRRVEFATATAGAEGRQAPQETLLEILPHAVSLFGALGFDVTVPDVTVRHFSDAELEVSWQLGGTTLLARIDSRSRPTFNELRVFGETGSATLDLFHGYAVVDLTRKTTQLTKLTRPFRGSVATLWQASLNLGRRALERTPAYPGLPELLAETYAAVRARAAQGPIVMDEFVIAARLNDELRRHRIQTNSKCT
jgi:predicted dehydrogenase